MSVRELRDQLGRRIDVAHFTGEPTIGERHSEPRTVPVPYTWWIEQQDRPAQGTVAP